MKRAIVELRYVGLPPATQIARGKVTLAVWTLMLRFALPGCLRNKWPEKKNLLAKPIHSDMKAGGESPGTISRNYEGVGKRPCVYPHFERLLRPALRGCRLPFQRNAAECSVYSQSPSAERRHDHAAHRDI
jgi:hypothetical protein